MSQFLSDEELKNFTGCRSPRGQIHWLKEHGIDHFVNSLGHAVVSRSCLDVVRDQKWRKQIFLPKVDVLKSTTMPRHGRGIYFLILKKEIIYIGKTTNFFVRMAAHDRSEMKFDSVAFFAVDTHLLDTFEHEYILRFSPKFNILLSGDVGAKKAAFDFRNR